MWPLLARWLNRMLRPRRRRGAPRLVIVAARSLPDDPAPPPRTVLPTRRRISTTVDAFEAHVRQRRH